MTMREALADALELRAWFDRRGLHLEQAMATRGIVSSGEVPQCEWEAMCKAAELHAGPRPSGTVTAPTRPPLTRSSPCTRP